MPLPTCTDMPSNQVSPEDMLAASEGDGRYFAKKHVHGMCNADFATWFVHTVNFKLHTSTTAKHAAVSSWSKILKGLHQDQRDEEQYHARTQSFLNALHTANLRLQKDTEAYTLVAQADNTEGFGKKEEPHAMNPPRGQMMWQRVKFLLPEIINKGNVHDTKLWKSIKEATSRGQRERAKLIRRCHEDPAFLLTPDTVGALPFHVAFIMKKPQLGLEMLCAVEPSPKFWALCEKLVQEYSGHHDCAHHMPVLPPAEERDTKDTVRAFLVNIPYLHDLKWWFEMFERRETEDKDGFLDLDRQCHFREYLPRDKQESIVNNLSSSLFGGETLLHIALQAKDAPLVQELLQLGASLDSNAEGLFFQPSHGDFRDVHRGTYFGGFPIHFAASLGDAFLMQTLTMHAQAAIVQALEDGWEPPRAGSRGHEELKARILRHDQSYVNLENAVVRADRREWSADDANAEDARKVSKGSKRGEKNRFLNLLAVEWGKICHDTDEEDWNPFFPSDCRLGNSEDGYFRRRSDSVRAHDTLYKMGLVDDLLLAFLNKRGKYGNTPLHLAVMHSNTDTIKWLLQSTAAGKPRGRPSLVLLNRRKLTPFTLSVRMAQADQESLESFHQMINCSYQKVLWQYGDCEMRMLSLYQMDSFRISQKKLHKNPKYLSALEIVVFFEIPVLTALPEFAELIDEKWNKFAFRLHVMYSIVPYAIFLSALTASILLRSQHVRAADVEYHKSIAATALPVYAAHGVPLAEGNLNDDVVRLRVALDLCTFVLGVPYLLWSSWFHHRLSVKHLDVNEDYQISWREGTMFFFKNFQTIFSFLLSFLLFAAMILRICSQQNWLLVSQDSVTPWTRENTLLKYELDVLAVSSVIAWCNALLVLMPFKGIGLLLIAIFRMLANDVSKWLCLYTCILVGFATGASIVMPLSELARRAPFDELDEEAVPFDWIDMLKFFIWASIGEVQPAGLLQEARNSNLITGIYISFIIISTLLLMTLLIGLVNNTFRKDYERGRQIWWLEFAYLVLRYERMLSDSQKLSYRVGSFDLANPHKDKNDEKFRDVEFFSVKVKHLQQEERERALWLKKHASAIAEAIEQGRFRECVELQTEQLKDYIDKKFQNLSQKMLPPVQDARENSRRRFRQKNDEKSDQLTPTNASSDPTTPQVVEVGDNVASSVEKGRRRRRKSDVENEADPLYEGASGGVRSGDGLGGSQAQEAEGLAMFGTA